MGITEKDTQAALRVQSRLEASLLSMDGVSGLSVSTLPSDHDRACVKIIVSEPGITLQSLGVQESYDGIPVIISLEDNRAL